MAMDIVKNIGKLIRLRCGLLEGYAYDAAQPNSRLELKLIIDNNMVASVIANHEYLGIGDGFHGFVIALPAQYYDGNSHEIDLQVVGNKTLRIVGFPIKAKFNPPVPIVPDSPPVPIKLQGAVDGINYGVLSGWAINPEDMADILQVELSIDGESVELTNADIYRPDLENFGSGKHAFRFTIAQDFFDNKTHQIRLTISSSDYKNAKPLILQQNIALNSLKNSCDGRVDLAMHPRVQGWAWNIRAPNETLELDIYIDGELNGKVKAGDMRVDLAKSGIGDGRKAFTYFLPDSLDPSREYQIEVRYADSEQNLRLSPIALSFPKSATTYNPYILHKNEVGEFVPYPQIDVQRSIWQLRALENSKPISVIIPIYNAYEEVKQSIASVLMHSSIAAEIILINDASTQQEIRPYLKKIAKLDSRIQVIHNAQNLGYTKTVNKAIAICGVNDVVLLNSDTIVTPNWLEHLRRCAHSSDDIGTVTAISNNAGAFSVPELETNALPEGLSPAQLGRLIAQNSLNLCPKTPTGNGFCMFIKRELLNEIGAFDCELFPRGYGEENEFCMRAIAHGWQHRVDDSCMIFHKRCASFGDEKAKLVAQANDILRMHYPQYSKLAADFCISPAMQQVRRHMRYLYQSLRILPPPKPRILYVIHGKATGGTAHTNRDLMRSLSDKYDIFLVECDRLQIMLQHLQHEEMVEVGTWQLQQNLSIAVQFSDDYSAIMQNILTKYAIELVHIRHLHKHSMDLPRVAAALNIPIVMSFHDFYFVCPSINLLDENQQFCAGKCTATIPKQGSDCALPYVLDETMPPLKHKFVHQWRTQVARIFPYVSAFVTTSHFARELICETYPQLSNSDFHIIEHGRDFAKQYHLAKQPSRTQPLKIIVASYLTKHKGAEFIEKLLELDAGKGAIEFHFLGNLPQAYAHLGTFHGVYTRDELPEKIAEIGGNVMGIFSVWAETYCHVLSEAWACGMPVIASNLGALKERIETHGGGWLVDVNNPQQAYTQICAIAKNAAQFKQKAKDASLTALRTIEAMASDYENIYNNLTHNFQ